MSDNNVTRHIDISNNVDVCNNTMVCTHTPSKVAIPSTDYRSQCDSKHLCDEVNKHLNCNTFWSNHKVVKSPGDGHCFIHAAANSLNVNSSMPTPFDDVSVILKQLSDETMHNSNRYVDFIDGNGRGSLLQGLNEYVNNRRYDTSWDAMRIERLRIRICSGKLRRIRLKKTYQRRDKYFLCMYCIH